MGTVLVMTLLPQDVEPYAVVIDVIVGPAGQEEEP